MPYWWQYREPMSKQWTSFSPDANADTEKLYCVVENIEVEVALRVSHSTYSR